MESSSQTVREPGLVLHLVLAILSFHSSDKKSPLSNWKKQSTPGEAPWITTNDIQNDEVRSSTYCVLSVFLPVPFHPLFKLFIHALRERMGILISKHKCCCGVLLQGNDEKMKREPGNPLWRPIGDKDTTLLFICRRWVLRGVISLQRFSLDSPGASLGPLCGGALRSCDLCGYLCIGSWNVCFLYTVVVFTVGCCCNLQHDLPHSCNWEDNGFKSCTKQTKTIEPPGLQLNGLLFKNFWYNVDPFLWQSIERERCSH